MSSNNIFQPIFPLEYKIDGSLQGEMDPEFLKSFHSDIKDSHQLNSHLEILQTTSSSKPHVLMNRNLTG